MPEASRESEDSLLRIVRGWPLAAGIAVAVLGALVLLGWAFDLQTLKQALPTLPAMKANTALGFLGLGLALARAARRGGPDAVAIGLAMVPLIIGAATLVEIVAGVDLRIDELLVRDDVTALATSAPGRMSPLTAAGFALAAAALVAARRQGATAAGVREALSVAMGLMAVLVLSAYAYGAEVLSTYTQMALHTAAAFLVTAPGLLLVGPGGPLGGLLRSAGTTGQVARRLLPASLAVPIAVGAARIELQRQGYVDTQQGATLFAVAMVAVLSGASIAILARLRRLEALRDAALAAEREGIARLRLASAERESFFVRNLDMMAIVGFDGRFRELNPAWQTTLGHSLDDMRGRPFLDFVHPEDLERTRAEAGRLSATGQPVPFENRYRRADGMYAWLRWTSTTSEDLQVFLATARDVTQEREAQARLRESEARFRLLFETNPGAVAISRADASGFVDVNPAYERLVGYSRAQLLDMAFDPSTVLGGPEGDTGILALLQRGGGDALELDVRRADGSLRRVVASVRPLDLDGRASFLTAMQDVTEQRAAQEAARRATERFERVFQASPVAICLTREDGRFVDVNDAFCGLVDRSREALVGGEVKAPETWEDPEERQRMLLAMRTLGVVRDLELRIKRPDGEVRTTLASIEFIDLGGDPMILSLLQDITDRLHMQEDREKRLASEAELERLRRTDSFRSEFINNIAHELATPLTPLVLRVKTLLADRTLSEAQRSGIETLERNVQRLRHLVHDMVGAADIQARNLALDKRRLNLTRELRAAVAAHHPAAERAGVAMDEPDDTGVTVSADPARLQLVLGHLLGNAIKFTPSGGRVSVTSHRTGTDEVRVEVKDTGVGLTRKQMEGLWKPFAQAHDKSQRTDSGSGLGLYVTKGIVELHGGEVGCYSPGPGQGSTFWFTLPLAVGHVDPLKVKAAPPEGETGPRRNLNPGVAEDV